MAEYAVGDGAVDVLSTALSSTPASKSALEAIRSRYAPVIRRLALRFAWDKDSLEELLQEGNLALAEALPRFDSSRGAQLGTFIHQRAQSRMRHWCRSQRRALSLLNPAIGRRLASLDKEIEGSDDGVTSLHDVVAADQDLPSQSAHLRLIGRFLQDVISRLAARQAEALRLRFWDELAPSEIAERLGVSRPRATVLVQDGVARLRGELTYLM